MRIGFLGNVANYPFALARAFRRMGHDVVFLVNRPERLYRPEYRYADVAAPYPGWIIDIGRMDDRDYVLPSLRRRRAVEILRGCDAVVLNDLGPSLLGAIRRAAVVLLTGSDLDYFANRHTVDEAPARVRHWPVFLNRRFKRFVYTRLVEAQRAGIRGGNVVIHVYRGLYTLGDRLLEEIGVLDSQRLNAFLVDLEEFRPEPLPDHDPVRVLCLTRLNWKRPMPPGYSEMDFKGSDVMIRGMGEFVRRTRHPVDFRIVKRGKHVAEAVRLAEREGLTGHISWLEALAQAQVREEMRQADIVFEQFGTTGFGSCALEALAIGRPIIMDARPEVMEPLTGPSPICQARTPQGVCRQLERLVMDRQERERVAIASRLYAERHFCVDRVAGSILDRLTANR